MVTGNSLICENCGGSLILKEGENIAVCDFCKSKFFVPGIQLRRYYIRPQVNFESAEKFYREILKSKKLVENQDYKMSLIFLPIFRFTGFRIGLSYEGKIPDTKKNDFFEHSFNGRKGITPNFKRPEKSRKIIKPETRVNEDFFEYIFDGSLLIEKGFIPVDFLNFAKDNIRTSSFYGFDRDEMEKYGVIFLSPDEKKMGEEVKKKKISIEKIFWDYFFFSEENSEEEKFKKGEFFKYFIEKDVELIFYPVYTGMAFNTLNSTFFLAIDGVSGKKYVSEILRIGGKKIRSYPFLSTLSVILGIIFSNGLISSIFLNKSSFGEIFLSSLGFLISLFLIERGVLKW